MLNKRYYEMIIKNSSFWVKYIFWPYDESQFGGHFVGAELARARAAGVERMEQLRRALDHLHQDKTQILQEDHTLEEVIFSMVVSGLEWVEEREFWAWIR